METRVIKIDTGNIDEQQLRQAAAIIDSGGLVGLPTETVYGIACMARNSAIDKLNKIKNRPFDKFYTLHIPDKQQVEKYVPGIGLRARKLVENCWPGPVTIVFELSTVDLAIIRKRYDKELFANLYQNNTIGVRCPEHPVASKVLSMAHNPVIAPSANISGQEPAAEAGQVIRDFPGRIDMVLDAGPCKYKLSSTVVKAGKGRIDILRPGACSVERILANSIVKILVICTGNSCRSPMAEWMFKKHLSQKLGCPIDRLEENGYKVSSAGTMGLVGLPASSEAIKACAEKNLDLSGHRSAALSRRLVEESDLIFALAAQHRDAVIELDAQAAKKCTLLWDDGDITDPIGQSQQVYYRCADVIEQAVEKRTGELIL